MAHTLRTISEQLGISQAAVSMILNHRPGDLSSAATRAKVFALAKELGYKQEFGHKLLRGEKTRTVAILVAMHRMLMEEQIQQLVLLLLDKFEKAGFTPSLTIIAGTEDENLAMTRELLQRGTEHFVFIGCPCGCDLIEKEIQEKKRTLIGFSSILHRNIDNDTPYAIGVTVRKFLEEGRKNFRVMIGSMSYRNRIKAVMEQLPGLPEEIVVDRHIFCTGFGAEVQNIDELTASGYRDTQEVLTRDPDVSALMYISDYHMMGGIRYLHEKGISIGNDIRLCGCNNIHAVRNGIVPLWSWQIDMNKISDMLVEKCSGEEAFNFIIKPAFKTTM